jgi:hypothetical protein
VKSGIIQRQRSLAIITMFSSIRGSFEVVEWSESVM